MTLNYPLSTINSIPLVIAHRGASHEAPENTPAAFRLAWESGADGIETDLRLTADGVVVAMHDADGRRTLREPRRIRDLSFAGISRLDAGSWKSPRWSDERVPSLEELLRACPARGRIVLDLKESDPLPARVARCVRQSKIDPARFLLIAFDPKTLDAAKQLLPECRALLLLDDYPSARKNGGAWLVRKARELRIDGFDLRWHEKLTASLLAPLRSEGLFSATYTVNTAAAIRRCAAIGLDALTTNRPAEAIRRLRTISA